MAEQIKTSRKSNASDSHARFHAGEWLDVVDEDSLTDRPAAVGELRTIECRCPDGNRVWVLSDEVVARREKPLPVKPKVR